MWLRFSNSYYLPGTALSPLLFTISFSIFIIQLSANFNTKGWGNNQVLGN